MTGNIVQGLRDEIENGIVTGTYQPGERLDEVQLAKRFGVSRTPVRECLIQLGAVGLVEIRPRRGAIVVDPGPHLLVEMFEVMAELEGLAGAHAARRHDANDRAALSAALDKCARASETGDTDAYYYENETFHLAIYAASHNGFLADQCAALHRRLRPYRRLQLRVHDRMKASFLEHSQIVKAILAGEADLARAGLRAHITVQGERFADLVSSLHRPGQTKAGGSGARPRRNPAS